MLQAHFQLSVSGTTTDSVGYLETKSVRFSAEPEAGAPGGFSAPTSTEERLKAGEALFWPWNKGKSVLRFKLGEPQVKEGARQRFLVTSKGVLDETEEDQTNETSCMASPISRALGLIAHPFRLAISRFRRSTVAGE